MGLATVLATTLDPWSVFEIIELKALNAQFQGRGPLPPSSPIVIVAIDENSFDALGLAWPWPRAIHAQLIDTLSRARPAAIGLDIVFAEPSPYGPEDDQALARAIAENRHVVLGAALTVTREHGFVKENLNPPIRPVRDGARGFGYVNFDSDVDAFVRRALLTHRYQGSDVAAFDLHLYRLIAQAGTTGHPLSQGAEIIINYRGGPRTFVSVPYQWVLAGYVPLADFAGKIVLVGASTPVLHDVFPTPFAPRGDMPGVEIHANALETLLKGIPIQRVPTVLVGVLAVLAGAGSLWVTPLLRPVLSLGLVGGATLLYLIVTHMAFRSGYWVTVLPVPMTLAITYVGAVTRNFVVERRQRRRLSRYFSPAVVNEIIRQKDDLNLSSDRRQMTVLFSDIRGFTSLSEHMPPEDVVAFLRKYLTVMTEVVFKHGGTVDKYVGDAIMALYNVPFATPDHAARAVRTALEFQQRLPSLTERFAARYGGKLACGVGINTGDAVVGTIGSEQRLEYTAIGDTINVGARLETLTKDFGVSVIISESTYLEVKGLFVTRDLGEVKVRGKDKPVRIYAVDGTVG